ncbi:DUF4328 domain-containing protein [Kitasatospora sp. NPDC004669]|uniref:DUF4328 domain-containing protein n=1 Tax=Kitasatospora sp. NPDC004669 TaxID=3154555 RepID=UPI0033BAF36B
MKDSRKVALWLQWTGVLSGLCFAAGRVLSLDSGTKPLVGLMGLLFVLFTVASFAVGAVWLRRSRANAELLAPGSQPFGSGLATAGWLVPGLSIVLRWPLMLGLWRGSGVRGAPVLIHLWWGASLATTVLGVLTQAHVLGSAAGLTATGLNLLHSVLFAVAVRLITARQVEALDLPPARPEPDAPAPENRAQEQRADSVTP